MRSGTTLLQRMLCASQGAHPFTEECQFLTALIGFVVAWRERFEWLEDFYGTPEGYETYARATVDAFLRASFETQRPARTIVLKNPELTVHFPRLADWYDKAKFLIIVRDPRDTIASILDVAQRHGDAGVASQIARIGRDMAKLSHFYKAHYFEALQSPKCKDRVLIVRYENPGTGQTRPLQRCRGIWASPRGPISSRPTGSTDATGTPMLPPSGRRYAPSRRRQPASDAIGSRCRRTRSPPSRLSARTSIAGSDIGRTTCGAHHSPCPCPAAVVATATRFPGPGQRASGAHTFLWGYRRAVWPRRGRRACAAAASRAGARLRRG